MNNILKVVRYNSDWNSSYDYVEVFYKSGKTKIYYTDNIPLTV